MTADGKTEVEQQLEWNVSYVRRLLSHCFIRNRLQSMPTGRHAPRGVGKTRQKDHRSEMNLADVTSLANGPVLDLIQWLQRQNCMANPLRCTVCNIPMELTQRSGDHVDGYFW